MKHVACRMQLHKGFEAEYKRRHDEIRPELKVLLSDSGISDYHIFLDGPSGTLFAYMQVADNNSTAENKNHEVMKRWWKYMGDIMATNPDMSPVATPLNEVFYLP